MKAWQFTGTHEPLTETEVEEPAAIADYVVVTIKAAGLCHTDLSILEVPDFLFPGTVLPLTIGHEIAGVISEVGEGVVGWSIGDRVGIALVSDEVVGLNRDGGYAAKVAVRPEVLVRIPDSVSFAQAAAGTDSGVTAYHAVAVDGQVGPGQKVGVIGFGGLGQIGARIAALLGAEVYVAEPKMETWVLAQATGATKVVADILDLADVGLDVIIDFAGFGTTTAGAIDVVRPGGRVVQIGLGQIESTISTLKLVQKSITLKGNLGGTKDDLVSVYEFLESGELDPTISMTSFDRIPEGLEALRRGEVSGRLVAIYGS